MVAGYLLRVHWSLTRRQLLMFPVSCWEIPYQHFRQYDDVKCPGRHCNVWDTTDQGKATVISQIMFQVRPAVGLVI